MTRFKLEGAVAGLVLALLILTAGLAAWASTPIAIGNAGFEMPTLADGEDTTSPPGWQNGYYVLTNPAISGCFLLAAALASASLTRAASSTCGRAKSSFLSVRNDHGCRRIIKRVIGIAWGGALCACLLLPTSAQCGGQTERGSSGGRGSVELRPEMPAGPEHWSAHWIVARDAIANKNLMFLARRSFALAQVPERSVIYITADTRYQLFVNGTFVLRGPARSAAHHQSYDALDIARFLCPGKNVLAVRVHHTGLARPYHETTRPGLLVQLELFRSGTASILGTDTQWKAMRDPSWDSNSPRIVNYHDAFVDIVDLRRSLDDWAMPSFDDSAWACGRVYRPGWGAMVAGAAGRLRAAGGYAAMG